MKNASLFSMMAVLVVIFLFGASSVQAGWLGPSNFDECVLEKMKGQAPNMIGVARSACQLKFPVEVLLQEGIHYKKGQIKNSWYKTSKDTITISIDENKTDYKVTRVVIKPMKELCDSPNLRVDDEVEAKSPMFGSKYVADVPDTNVINCAIIDIWGKKK